MITTGNRGVLGYESTEFWIRITISAIAIIIDKDITEITFKSIAYVQLAMQIGNTHRDLIEINQLNMYRIFTQHYDIFWAK